MARKPIYNEDVIERLPVCLRFDKNDEFYKEFVIPLKQTRELSGFIVKLLKTYYDQENVAKAVDEVLEDESPFAAMHESLEKIAELNMNNQMAINSMKGAVNAGKSVLNGVQGDNSERPTYSSVVEGFEDTVGFEVAPQMERALLENRSIVEVIKEQSQQEIQSAESKTVDVEENKPIVMDAVIEQRFKKIEDKLGTVDDMNSKLDILLRTIGGGVGASTVESSKVEIPVENSEIVVENNIEKVEESIENNVKVEPIVEIKAGIEYEHVEETVNNEIELDAGEDLGVEESSISNTPMSVEAMMAEAMKLSQAKADEETKSTPKTEEVKPKVPKAFKKLAGSI